MSRKQIVNYNISNVPKPGQHYICHSEFTESSIFEFNQENVMSKVVFLGDSSVGKTCLSARMMFDEFQTNYQATIGAQFIKCIFSMNGIKANIQIWDIAGQEAYSTVSLHYCRAADIALFCFDLTRPETLDNLNRWKARFLDITQAPASMFLIGCKSDLKPVVKDEVIQKFAESNKMEYFSTSAKESKNGKELMERIGFYALLTSQAKKKMIHKPIKMADNVSATDENDGKRSGGEPQSVNIAEDEGNKKKKKGCC